MTTLISTNAPTAPPAATPGMKRWFRRLPAILVLIGIGIGQVFVAVLLLRSGSETKEGEHPPVSVAHESPTEHAALPSGEGEHEAVMEVDLGSYSLTVPRPGSKPLLVSFRLFGTIGEHQHADFAEKIQAHQHRLRQEVLLLVRNTPTDVLTDPELGELKQRLLARINKLLGKAALGDIIFSDFAVLENQPHGRLHSNGLPLCTLGA